MAIDHFVSIDWGTTNFRIRVIDTSTLKVQELIESAKGVKEVYSDWLKKGGSQQDFYLDFLIEELSSLTSIISESAPIMISGMASSSIGLKELPYAKLPFNIDGNSLNVEKLLSKKLSNPIYLVSGVRSNSDVIRGEEVQIVGLSNLIEPSKQNVFILPGTHSKHIVCENNEVIDFKTYMTGEIFEVISEHTILKNSIETGMLDQEALLAFENGVREAQNGVSILNSLFKVRTNALFGELKNQQNFYFLSGLLIGEELKSLASHKESKLHLCAGGQLFKLYKTAIEVLGLNKITSIVPKDVVDSAVIRGQYKLLKTVH